MINRSVISSSSETQLLSIIADVRTRWRLKLFLKGAAIVLAAGVIALVISAWGIERLGFSPASVIAFRIITWLTVIGLAIRYIVFPMLRRVSDETIALYLEEHEPTLQAAVLSALTVKADAKATGSRKGGEPAHAGGLSEGTRPAHALNISPALARRTIEQAVERCHAIEDGRRVDQPHIRRFGIAFAGAAALGLIALLMSPGFLRHGATAVLNPFSAAAAVNPYHIDVQPGNVTIPRGADQAITAQLGGFSAGFADVVFGAGADSVFDRLQMTVGQDSNAFELMLFGIDRNTEYFVESNGIRSAVYTITVADIPYVSSLRLEYHYPAYTGLEPRTVENGGDIAALPGTTVKVFATTTLPVASGQLVVEGREPAAMTVTSNSELAGDVHVSKDGFYHIELPGPDGKNVTGSPQYTIEVLDDMPPTVSFTKPGSDTRATPIEEVFIEAKAEDDYGISKLDLVYSVNGGEEKTIPLMDSRGTLPEVVAGHTFFLEELSLQPGDLISYYARATDNNSAGRRKDATSDIYFLTIRPYELNYRQAEAAGGGGGGGGGGGEDEGRLSDQQREIIAATFNVQRDSAGQSGDEYKENLVTIALSQEKLREQVGTLVERMNNRGITDDSAFQAIAQMLPQASAAMDTAAKTLRDTKPTEALPPEQRALQVLLHAEALFRDIMVQMGQQQGGGGGGGGSPNAEDLADLFELELDKLRNQYETVQRGEREQAQNQIDETLERLKELARRQQQENERMRRQAQSGQGGGGASSQRELAEETEQAARELERLAREQNNPEMMDAARRLQEAADAMRQNASNQRNGSAAEGQAALDRLRDARRRLENNRTAGLQQQANEALQRAEQIARDQEQIQQQMQDLSNLSGAERAERARRLVERKEQQLNDVAGLERDLQRMGQEARTNQQADAASALQQAAEGIQDNQLKEKISYSRALTQPGADPEYSRSMEREISSNIETTRGQIAEAAEALGEQAAGLQGEENLDRARDLARGLESLEERTRNAQEQRRLGDRPGQEGQQGQQGEQGQRGQGQQGQRGQGQQGRGGRAGDQQGQQGQAGQQNQGGQQDTDSRGGRMQGAPTGPGGGGDMRPGDLTPDQVRQFRSEARQRLQDAQQLREELRRQGMDTGDLDQVIRDLGRLTDERVWGIPKDLETLQAAVVDGVKQFEYRLRRELGATDEQKLQLSGSDEVPEGFRTFVEEYYRALARRRN
ncbi:MAG: DUF4175 family protein [Longimicrobiales bacterium]